MPDATIWETRLRLLPSLTYTRARMMTGRYVQPPAARFPGEFAPS